MKIGDKVTRRTVTMSDPNSKEENKRTMSGRVVYIHPEGRYHVVEFTLPGGHVRECFQGACE